MENTMEVKNFKDDFKNVEECLGEIISGRRKMQSSLKDHTQELDKLASDVRNCKITGGVAGVVGTGLVVGGLALSFVTFGASLAVTAIGAGVGASGAIVASGASIADAVIGKKKRKLINALIEEDEKLIKKFESCFEDLNLSLHVLNVAQNVAMTTKTIVTNAVRFVNVADTAVDVSRTAFASLRVTAKVFSIAGAVVSIVFLPLDIHTIVINAIATHKGDKHKISKDLQKFEDDIENELTHMEDMLAEIINAESKIDSC